MRWNMSGVSDGLNKAGKRFWPKEPEFFRGFWKSICLLNVFVGVFL